MSSSSALRRGTRRLSFSPFAATAGAVAFHGRALDGDVAESHVPPLVDALSRPPPDELDLEHPADAQDGLGELEPRDAGGEVERFGARLAAPTSGVEIVRFGRPEVLAEIVAAAVFSARVRALADVPAPRRARTGAEPARRDVERSRTGTRTGFVALSRRESDVEPDFHRRVDARGGEEADGGAERGDANGANDRDGGDEPEHDAVDRVARDRAGARPVRRGADSERARVVQRPDAAGEHVGHILSLGAVGG